MRGFADRRINTRTRQTRRSPTHNRHKTIRSRESAVPDGTRCQS